MAEDVIEVCSKCGKMPRGIDLVNGSFRCTRCGNTTITPVSTNEYEKIVTDLDQRYHAEMSRKRLETVEKIVVPNIERKGTSGAPRKKTVSKKKPEKKKAAKKSAKKGKK
jgi:hypothetical protein